MTTSPRARSRFLGLAPAAFLLAGLCAVSAGPSAVPVAAGPPTGAVIAWGDNTYGQTDVPAGLSGVTAISAGGGHNLTPADGTVVGWGDDTWGQIDVPAGLSDIVAISAGGGFSLALKSDGTVVAWGRDDYGAIDVPAGLSGDREMEVLPTSGRLNSSCRHGSTGRRRPARIQG